MARQVRTPVDLFAFGSSPEGQNPGPRVPRIAGYNLKEGQKADMQVDAAGLLIPSSEVGVSTFANPHLTDLTGHYYRLPANTELPEGFEVIADGLDVEPDSLYPATHHTIYLTRAIFPKEFIEKYRNLGWEYGGKKA